MHKYVVVDNQQITPTTLLLTLKSEQLGSTFSFQPGQYAAISFFHKNRPSAARCFSIVSSPTQQDTLQFSMRTKGRYTKALTRLKVGDEVRVRGPFGAFILDKERDSKVVLLAGGIGITPFMSMIRYAAATRSPSNIHLIYSCQTESDVPFGPELVKLQQENPRFKVSFVIGDGVISKLPTLDVFAGRISSELLGNVVGHTRAFSETSFFICGPPPFMKAMTKLIHEKGAPAEHIMTEAFSQGPNRQTGKIQNWPYNMYALTALGVGAGSFLVMVGDLLKTLPPSSILGSSNTITASTLTNSRQADLDSLVNGLQTASNPAPESDAVKAAIAAANPQPTTSQKTTTSKPTTTLTPTPAPSPTPTPAPTTPPPKPCTTPSGRPC